MLYLNAIELALLGVALGIGILLGAMLGRAGKVRAIAEVKAKARRLETQVREQTRTITRLRSDQSSASSLGRMLPNFIRELNRSDLDPRRIPDLIVKLAMALFEPKQVLLYLVGSPGSEGNHPTELHLRAQRGLSQTPQAAARVALGAGKIGWVAESKVEMLAEDWLNLTRTDGHAIDDNHPAFRLDLLGPLVHHSSSNDQVLGVLCVGSPGIRHSEEKLMIQMITNLGSIALMNAHNLSMLTEQANHDGLTGLMNKRSFMKKLGLMINTAEREAQPLGVFIFDLDYFKRYNDSNGHLAGDELLKTVPQLVRDNLRPGDLACRYGGEEFIVALPETDTAGAYDVAEKVRKAIEDFPFPHGEAQPGGKVTISGGVAAFPVHGTSCTELISHSDQALYQAKGSGRNRIARYQGVEIGDPDVAEGGGDSSLFPGVALER